MAYVLSAKKHPQPGPWVYLGLFVFVIITERMRPMRRRRCSPATILFVSTALLAGVFFITNIVVTTVHGVNHGVVEVGGLLPDAVASSRHPRCMLSAFHQLCLSLDNSTGPMFSSARERCHRDPQLFLRREYQGYKPSSAQSNARALMHEKQIRRLSIGAGPDKMLVCSDVTSRSTLCTERKHLDLFEMNSWISLALATHSLNDTTIEGFDVIFAGKCLRL